MELLFEGGMLKLKIPRGIKESSYIYMKMQEVICLTTLDIGSRIDYMKEININTNSDVILVAYRGYSDS